ncbi:MAG TPA: glycosyl hydrolase, partial [Rhodothermales bacterium]|nr:glycosyl hydrolase [Rhodothermales bacterium]
MRLRVRSLWINLVFVLSLFVVFSLFSPAQPLDISKFAGMKARSIGPAGMSGRVTAIAVVHDNPSVMYIGAASGGVWKSTDGGVAWTPIFDDEPVAGIGALAVNQQNPDIVWVGTGEGNPRNSENGGNGVYKSMDGGRTWIHLGLENTRNIHRIILDPTDPDVAYIGAKGPTWGETESRGVFKTTDGGKSWLRILFTDVRSGVSEMVMDPQNPKKMIVGMWEHRRWPWFFKSGGMGSGLFLTTDGGITWKRLGKEDGLPEGDIGRTGIAIAPSRPNIVYALIESKKNGLYKSSDGGHTWSFVTDKNIGSRPFYFWEIYVDPGNENRIYNLHVVVDQSEDGGKTFQNLIPYNDIHPDYHAMWIHPKNPNYMMVGNDGGVAISQDRGKTWRFVENLPLAQFYHINVDNALPYNVYGGLQDNGSWRGPA